MNERLVRSLSGVFHRHGLASEVTEEGVTRATELPLLSNIVHILIPNHVLVSDSERIYQDTDIIALVNDVSQITFFFGDPEMFFMFQIWWIGVDNPRIWCEN